MTSKPTRLAPWMLLTAACLIAMTGFGVRSTFGLFTAPLSEAHGWGREVFAFAVAIQNLLWGIGQPFAGALADRFGTARVLTGGAILYAVGVALTAVVSEPILMTLSAGVMVGLGISGASFTLVLAALGRLLPPAQRSWGLGMATAAGSFGQFVFAPLGQAFIQTYQWDGALFILAACVLCIVLLSPALRGRSEGAGPDAGSATSLTAAIGQAARHPSFWWLTLGFFVCGFHVAFITVHMPPYLADIGTPPALAGWSLAMIGLFNVIGAYSSGILGGRYSRRWLLSGLYGGRALAIALLLILPKTTVTVLCFSAAMGLLWLSTVPLTSGLVALMFGTRYLATLFGFVFLSHQIGAFLGVWLGGIVYAATGSYDPMWWMGIALGLMAAIVHLPIREQAAPALAPG